MIKHLTILAIAIFTASLAANIEANELASSIRTQGAGALAEIKGEFRENVARVDPARFAQEPHSYPVGEAIRTQGRRALSSIRWELELQFHQVDTDVAASVSGESVVAEAL